MRLVIDTPGLYRVLVEPGQQTIIYGYAQAGNAPFVLPYSIDPKQFQDGPTDTPSA